MRMDRPLSVEPAGPRKKIFFDPTQTKAAIVTCGGLCPGINDVIRSVTMTLFYRYGVKNILGIKYGLRGLNPAFGDKPIHADAGLMSKTLPTSAAAFFHLPAGRRMPRSWWIISKV